jgi:uncharacterized membrane protein
LIKYLMSVVTFGIFWVGQPAQLHDFARGDRHLAWIHIAFLCTMPLMPISTQLLAEFISDRTALLAYWGTVLLGLVLYASWRYASRAGVVQDDTPVEVGKTIARRIIVGQALYALGAALCVVHTSVSIAFIVLVQLSFAVAPRFRPGARRS